MIRHLPVAKRRFPRLVLFTLCSLSLVGAIGLGLLALHWPFGQREVMEALKETVPGTEVTVAQFHSTFFRHPGCWATGVVFTRPADRPAMPPLATIQRLFIQANYMDLFLRPGHISRIVIDGLYVRVPPGGGRVATENSSVPDPVRARRTFVEEIVSSGAVLEVGRWDSAPLKFEIHDIRLHAVGFGQTLSYAVTLGNPLPPGEIESSGQLGPWNSQAFGQIPVSGSYKFRQAELGVFSGIEGTLSSTGRFRGKMAQIDVLAEAHVPDFALKTKGHAFGLRSEFEARVDARNGDVQLTRVNALLQNTPIHVQGTIAGKMSRPGKFTSLDLVSTEARLEDVLRPFLKAPSPPMWGPMKFRVHVTFSSQARPFLKIVRLAGDFSIARGRFSAAETQENVDRLSERSRGIRDAGKPETVDSDLSGHVLLSDGVAKFSDLSMSVPGALAQMKGTFNVLNERIDLHGTLKTDVKLSDTTHGLKALLLKPLDPLFARRRGGALIPVEMTGTYSQPHFGMEVGSKGHPARDGGQ